MHLFLAICLAISVIGMFTTEQVSGLLGPKGPGFFAIPRTIFAVLWFTVGSLICLVFALFFGLLLALV